jgi:hypothetical protein
MINMMMIRSAKAKKAGSTSAAAAAGGKQQLVRFPPRENFGSIYLLLLLPLESKRYCLSDVLPPPPLSASSHSTCDYVPFALQPDRAAGRQYVCHLPLLWHHAD